MNWLARITNDWLEYLDSEAESSSVNADFAELPLLHSGLIFFIAAGEPVFGEQRIVQAQSSVVLTDNDDNFVFYDPAP